VPTALITGITGQDGSYLAELLLEKGYHVVGIIRGDVSVGHERIGHLIDRVEVVAADLLDQGSLENTMATVQPDEIYNLAAQSFMGRSWADPVMTGELTALGVTRMLEAMKTSAPHARFYQASSSEMFGCAAESPQHEFTPLHPRSPYAVAKAYGHWITVNYRESFGLFAVSGILFNHESPRRGLEFVTRKITDSAARIKLGLGKELRLGNLDALRDWGFAGEYVGAMWRMLQQDDPEDYVIGTGCLSSVRDVCEAAFSHVGLNYQDYVVVDTQFVRPAEDNLHFADSSKAAAHLEWRPRVTLQALVQMMVEADLARHEGSPEVSGATTGSGGSLAPRNVTDGY